MATKEEGNGAEHEDDERPAKRIKTETCSADEVKNLKDQTLGIMMSCLPNLVRAHRKILAINNTCELVLGGEQSEKLYLTSRGKNQFFDKRELCPGRNSHSKRPRPLPARSPAESRLALAGSLLEAGIGGTEPKLGSIIYCSSVSQGFQIFLGSWGDPCQSGGPLVLICADYGVFRPR